MVVGGTFHSILLNIGRFEDVFYAGGLITFAYIDSGRRYIIEDSVWLAPSPDT